MFNNSSKILFILIAMTGSLITMSSNSWLGMWMGLEINLLAFIPLMSDSSNLMATEASLVYFLSQALASSVLLLGILLLMTSYSAVSEFSPFSSLLITSSLLMKSGAAPFYFWFPMVVEGLSWINAIFLMTWQKMAPLVMISYIIPNKIIMMSVILCVVVGSIGGLNQTSLRKLLAYSSINHLGWMLISMESSEILWMNYFIFYCFVSSSIMVFFYSFSLYNTSQLFFSFSSSPVKFGLFINLLSLGGLPPFLGFFPKWLTIQMLSSNNQYLLLIVLLMCSLITLFFYLRLCYSSFMLSHTENNWNVWFMMNKSTLFILFILSTFSSFGLLFISLSYLLM